MKTKIKMQFDPELAQEVGVEEAIMYANLEFWVEKNRLEKSERHFKKDKYWTWNSHNEFQKHFPFWSEKQIRRILLNLKKAGKIETGVFNKKKYDNTKWYTTEVEKPSAQTGSALCPNGKNPLPKRAGGVAQTGRPIPDNKHQIINTDNSIDIDKKSVQEDDEPVFPPEKKLTPLQEIVATYSRLWKEKYGTEYRVSNWGRVGNVFKPLLRDFSLDQIKCFIYMHFNWYGSSGENELVHKNLADNCYPIDWIPNSVNNYIVYLRNYRLLDWDNKEEVKKFIENKLL